MESSVNTLKSNTFLGLLLNHDHSKRIVDYSSFKKPSIQWVINKSVVPAKTAALSLAFVLVLLIPLERNRWMESIDYINGRYTCNFFELFF